MSSKSHFPNPKWLKERAGSTAKILLLPFPMLLQHTKPVCSKCTHFRTKRLKATLLWRVFCAGLACKCCCAKHEAKCTVLVSSGAFIAFLADIGEKDIRLNIQEMQKNPIRATFHATCFLKRTRFQVCS